MWSSERSFLAIPGQIWWLREKSWPQLLKLQLLPHSPTHSPYITLTHIGKYIEYKHISRGTGRCGEEKIPASIVWSIYKLIHHHTINPSVISHYNPTSATNKEQCHIINVYTIIFTWTYICFHYQTPCVSSLYKVPILSNQKKDM